MTAKGNTNFGSERRVIYSMNVSLDGFVETPDRGLDWVIVDEELHTFFNDQARETGAFVYGRRMYEVMSAYWPTADENPSAPEFEVDFARIWKSVPKIVFSNTLEHVEWNSTLVRGKVAEEIAKLKEEPGKDLAVGGATLASTLVQLDLIDEYRPLVHPVVLGGGTPMFPLLDRPVQLRLLETRTFASGVVYLRYESAEDTATR